jgi:hypothetical protein
VKDSSEYVKLQDGVRLVVLGGWFKATSANKTHTFDELIMTQHKFIRVDPSLKPPAFSEHAVVEVKFRDGRLAKNVKRPWELEGWNHSEWLPDEFRTGEIIEYREIK